MKKLFPLLIFAIFVVNNSVALATEEEVKELDNVKKMSVAAFAATEDYCDLINKQLYLVAKGRVEDYKKVSVLTKKMLESLPNGSAKKCAWYVDMIITERIATLDAYVKWAECYNVGDTRGCNAYNSQISYRGARAAKLLKEFISNYNLK